MEQLDITNRILFLVPGARFSVWSCSQDQYQGEPNPIELMGFLIDWNKTNEKSCPTKEAIESVNMGEISLWKENARKEERNARLANDLSLVASYEIEKKTNEKLEWDAYLDSLEAKSAAMKMA